VFIPITIAGPRLGFTPTWLFILSALAIIPLAKFIGDARAITKSCGSMTA
jgi:Ca2+/H+ antiporter